MESRLRMHALALASGILFGLATPASKALLDGMGPFVLAGLLYLGAAVAMGLVQARKRDTLRPTGNDRWRLLGSIAFGGILGPVLLLFGLRQAHAGSVSIWLNLELVWTAVLGIVLFREHLGRWAWAAVVLVLAASGFVALEEQAAGFAAGALVALACLCWGFDNQFTARIRSISAPAMTLWKGLAAGITNLAIGLAIEGGPELAFVPGALLIGAVSYGVSIIWYVMAARQIGATRAQVSFSTAPLWGVLAAILVLDEPWSWRLAIGLTLVGAALVCLARESHEAASRQPAVLVVL
jgi:drug/metabolite transporter (DMT)-like permease